MAPGEGGSTSSRPSGRDRTAGASAHAEPSDSTTAARKYECTERRGFIGISGSADKIASVNHAAPPVLLALAAIDQVTISSEAEGTVRHPRRSRRSRASPDPARLRETAVHLPTASSGARANPVPIWAARSVAPPEKRAFATKAGACRRLACGPVQRKERRAKNATVYSRCVGCGQPVVVRWDFAVLASATVCLTSVGRLYPCGCGTIGE
jgi:hypothetical protein